VRGYGPESIHNYDSGASSTRSGPGFEQFDPTFGIIPATSSPNSFPVPLSGRHMLGAPVQLLSRKPSLSNFGKDSDSSRSDSPVRKVTMESFVTNIDFFVHALNEVTSLRVASQQKRKALIRSRENVSRKDAAIAKMIRDQRAKGSTLDQDEFLSLSDASLQARDELGALEDDFEKIEYQIVPKEDDLNEIGEELEYQLANLKLDLDRSSKPPSIGPLGSQPGQDAFFNPDPNSATEKGAESSPNRGRAAHRLSNEYLLQLPGFQDDTGRAFRIQGTTQFEPLVRQYAPDLFFGNSWTPSAI
jgi:hypothetical protein